MACILVSTDVINQWWSTDGISWNYGHETTSQSHWRWSFYASTNEVLSLTIKMTDVSLMNEEEQLSTTPLDNQGGTWVRIPKRTLTHQPRINKNQDGLMWEEHATVRMVQRKGKILLNGLQAFADRNETMRGAEGSNAMPRSTKKGQKDGLIRGWERRRET